MNSSLFRFPGSNIRRISVERSEDAAFDITLEFFGDAGPLLRLSGARSLPDFEELFVAPWVEVVEDKSAQLEFGRITVSFSSEAYYEFSCDSCHREP